MNRYLQDFWQSKLLVTVTAGILLGLSYPPFPLPFLTFPAFFCLFRLLDLSGSAREAAFWAYPGFLIWNSIVTYWLTLATAAGGVAAILANSAVMTLPVMLQYKFQRSGWPPWALALFQAASWLSFEYLHHHWDLSWPWLTAGNAWANVPSLVQYISVTGYWGISFWILFTSALAYRAVRLANKKLAYASGGLFFVFPLISLAMLWGSAPAQPDERQQVVVVQPNFDSYEPNGGFKTSARATGHLLRLSDSLRTPDTQLIVWPENAIQSDISNLDRFGNMAGYARQRLHRKAEEWETAIIGGATYFEFYEEDNAPPLPYFNSEGRAYLPFNSALEFAPDQPVQIYRKHNLVPIVERIPFVHFLNTIDIFGLVNWNRIQGYGKGEEADQFAIGDTYTPALICYDSVYPGWIRNYLQQGSGYLTIITNDGWWGNTSGHSQHFAYARLRAIEFDRWVVRSANNGISGIIAPDGSVKVKTEYGKATAFRYEVPVLATQTVYARLGDWLPALLLVLSAGGLGFLLIRGKG